MLLELHTQRAAWARCSCAVSALATAAAASSTSARTGAQATRDLGEKLELSRTCHAQRMSQRNLTAAAVAAAEFSEASMSCRRGQPTAAAAAAGDGAQQLLDTNGANRGGSSGGTLVNTPAPDGLQSRIRLSESEPRNLKTVRPDVQWLNPASNFFGKDHSPHR